MELKFTLKIKDEQNPPVFRKGLGKGVLQKVVVDFNGATEEDLKNNSNFHRQIHEFMNKLKEDWVEVDYEKVNNKTK